MAGLQDHQRIDVVAFDADDTVLLVMIESRPWDGSEQQEKDLWLKLDTYTGYVVTNQLYEDYPDAKDHPVEFQLACVQEPTEDVLAVLEAAAARLDELNISLGYDVNPDIADED